MKKISGLSFLIIVGVWLFFAVPYYVKNTTPFPSNYQVSHFTPWSSYSYLHGPVKNGAMPDIVGQIYPWRKLVIDIWKTGTIPLWNPYSFSGTPLLANYQSAVLSPLNILLLVIPFVEGWRFIVLLQPLLAGLFTYIYMRSLKISTQGSTLSALAFMFCGFITSWMGYATLGYAILFLPLALFFIEKYLDTKRVRYIIFYSFVFPLSFFSGHFQISLYFLMFVCAYLVFLFIRKTRTKDFILIILFTVLGMFLTLPQLLPSLELYSQSYRSELYQKAEVIPWSYIPTLFAPDYYGNPVTRNDWFGHYAEWNAYLGVIPLMLALYSLFTKRKKEILFFATTALIAILLAFGTPLLDFLVWLHVPVLSTSAASRVIVLFSFSFAVLAGFGLDMVVQDVEKKKNKKIGVLIIAGAAILVLMWASTFLSSTLPSDKLAIAKSNLRLPSVILVIFLTLIGIAVIKKFKKVISAVVVLLLLVTALDMYRFTTKWQPFDPQGRVFVDVPVSSTLYTIGGYERGFGDYGAEVSNSYKIPSIQGYDALYIHKYGQFIASLNTGKLQEAARSVVDFPKRGDFSLQGLNLLGVKYIIHKTSDSFTPWAFPVWSNKEQFSQMYNDKHIEIYENKSVFPRAYLVGSSTVLKDQQEILSRMFNKSFDLKKSIVLEKEIPLKIEGEGGTVKVSKYEPNSILLTTSSPNNSILFLSDSYYPGWRVYVDGNESEVLRANFAFRAVAVPKGSHSVEFKYSPMSFYFGIIMSLVGIGGIIVTSIFLKKINR